MTISYSGQKQIELKNGGVLTAKRLSWGVQTKLAVRCRFKQGETSSEMLYAYWLVRAAIVNAVDIKDQDGNAVQFKLSKDPELGMICNEEVVNALTLEDRDAITMVLAGNIGEDTAGNS